MGRVVDVIKWLVAVRKIIIIGLAWVVIVLGFQTLVSARYAAIKPDRVLFWTADATQETFLQQQPYFNQAFFPAQAAWDSEYYLSIALEGYDDPRIRTIPPEPAAKPPFDRPISLNYAFFPVYPHLIRLVAIPLIKVGLMPIDAATIAGVFISVAGTFAGMIALFDWVRADWGEAAGMRAVFYLITFPTSFFLAQVYTEGLFIGLAFGCLALMGRKRFGWASGLVTIATLTRAVGLLLIIPLAWAGWQALREERTKCVSDRGLPDQSSKPNSAAKVNWRKKAIGLGAMLLAPIMTHLIWRFSFFGGAFKLVEKYYFQCELLALSRAASAWSAAFLSLFGENSQTQAYYAIEFGVIGLGITSCLLTLRRYPGIALFGLGLIVISMTCGLTWSMSRYLLTVPSIYLVLSQWGKNELFDRIWTMGSLLTMGLLVSLFTFHLWAG